ncbi:ER membrane protein complex subunit 6-like [Apostichopus japonicus]|uniref:ER membrane protein complex subunit 6-like n=1 Tax=Stichopus japonicus TaxID=307972 RepID=UPI003AB590FB
MASDRRLAPSSSKIKETVIFNDLAMRGNMSIINYSRTFMSAVSGAAAGILGLTGLYGFVFYFVTAFFLSTMLLFKAGRHVNQYFKTCRPIFTMGLFGGLFTYILFWTFLYGMVHVY